MRRLQKLLKSFYIFSENIRCQCYFRKMKGKEQIVQQTYSTVPFITSVTSQISTCFSSIIVHDSVLSLMTLWKRGLEGATLNMTPFVFVSSKKPCVLSSSECEIERTVLQVRRVDSTKD